MEDLPEWLQEAWKEERLENAAFRQQTASRLDSIADWILKEDNTKKVRLQVAQEEKEKKESRSSKIKTVIAIAASLAGMAGVARGFFLP